MKDIIYVEHQNFVSVAGNSFKFVNKLSHDKSYVPVDGVDWLIFDHERSYFSKRLITVCLNENIGILFCDEKKSPKAVLITEYGHSKKLERLILQLELNKKTKQRLWRKMVLNKIENQADCLNYIAGQTSASEQLYLIKSQVSSDDVTNKEAHAARVFFKSMFGETFKRGRTDDVVNAGLNYGYALIRAMIRKTIATCGLEPALGIKHHSKENPFNLSDDFIEAYRPFVDAIVYEMTTHLKVQTFDFDAKRELMKIFFEKCVIDGKIYTLSDAIQLTVESYLTCLTDKSSAPLKLPKFIEVGR